MTIDDIIEMVYLKDIELINIGVEPKLVIYIGLDLYKLLISEVQNKCSYQTITFFENRTIHGHSVIRVLDDPDHFNIAEIN
jgi:hypothetical protein